MNWLFNVLAGDGPDAEVRWMILCVVASGLLCLLTLVIATT